MSHQNQKSINDDNLSLGDEEEEEFVRVDQLELPVGEQKYQNGHGLNATPSFHCSSLDTSIFCIGNECGLQTDETNWKMAALEAKNEMLEGKLENQQLRFQIRALQQENEALKLKDAEQKANKEQNAQMEEWKMAFLESQRKLEEFYLKMNELEGIFKLKCHQVKGHGTDSAITEFDAFLAIPNHCSGAKYAIDNSTGEWLHHVLNMEAFPISGEHCQQQEDHFPAKILAYFEVTRMSPSGKFLIGLSAHGSIPNGSQWVGGFRRNSYFIRYGWAFFCRLSGVKYDLEWPAGAIRPKWDGNDRGNGVVLGCGILFNSKNQLAIFFTFNGSLLGTQMLICPSVDHLVPTFITRNVSLEANFGEKPFEYNIEKCPGLSFQ